MATGQATGASNKTTGFRELLSLEQQQAWLEGEPLEDADERPESVELRFKYLPRYQKLLARSQAAAVFRLQARPTCSS